MHNLLLAAEVRPCGQTLPRRGRDTTEGLSCPAAFLWISATKFSTTSGRSQNLLVQTVERGAQSAEACRGTQPPQHAARGWQHCSCVVLGACPLDGAFSPRDCLRPHPGLCVLKVNGKHVASCFLGKAWNDTGRLKKGLGPSRWLPSQGHGPESEGLASPLHSTTSWPEAGQACLLLVSVCSYLGLFVAGLPL